jgi:ABC-2 type transport system ATP-binding protein
VGESSVLNIQFGPAPDTVVFETQNRDRFFSLLPRIFVENKIDVEEITSPDDNLQAVFDYLIGK